MPNWCYTSYVVTGDQEELDDLYSKMQSLENSPESLVPNDFGPTWLGNLVTLFKGDWKKIKCRGYWTFLDRSDYIHFETETAWVDMRETFDFIESKYDTIKFYYQSEEPGCEYYVTNDLNGDFFPERYCFTPNLHQDTYLYMSDEEDEFLKDVSKTIGVEVCSLEEAKEEVYNYNKNKNYNDSAHIIIYEIVN